MFISQQVYWIKIGSAMASVGLAMYFVRQFRKPTGWLGRLVLGMMNYSHAGLTAWGLGGVEIGPEDVVLDVGCGGGGTIGRLATVARRVCGVDVSTASVAASRAYNRELVAVGRVDVREGRADALPFGDGEFDVVAAVETHYYWPDRSAAMREIRRVLKPGGQVVVIGEAFRGQRSALPFGLAMKVLDGAYLTVQEHREWFETAGLRDVVVDVEERKGWIAVRGRAT